MKGVLLALLSILCYMLISIPFLRRYQGRKPYRVLQVTFLFSTGLYAALFTALPPAASWLSTGWIEPNRTADFWNGLLIMLLLYQPYLALYYATTFNGVSAQMMVLLHEHGPQSGKELIGRFSLGGSAPGDDPTTSWRLLNLAKGGYLEPSGAGHRILPKGRAAARLGKFLKWLFVGEEAAGS